MRQLMLRFRWTSRYLDEGTVTSIDPVSTIVIEAGGEAAAVLTAI